MGAGQVEAGAEPVPFVLAPYDPSQFPGGRRQRGHLSGRRTHQVSSERSSLDERSHELEKLLLQRKRPSPIQVWNRLQREEQAHAVRSFLEGDPEGRSKLNGLLARSLRYQVATIRKWPEGRLVAMLLARQIPSGEAAKDLLVHGQLSSDRPVARMLLDRMGIPHRDGRVDSTEKLDASGAAVRGRRPQRCRRVRQTGGRALPPGVSA